MEIFQTISRPDSIKKHFLVGIICFRQIFICCCSTEELVLLCKKRATHSSTYPFSANYLGLGCSGRQLKGQKEPAVPPVTVFIAVSDDRAGLPVSLEAGDPEATT